MKTLRCMTANFIDTWMPRCGIGLLWLFLGFIGVMMIATVGLIPTGYEYVSDGFWECFLAGLPWVSGTVLFVCSLIFIWQWSQHNKCER